MTGSRFGRSGLIGSMVFALLLVACSDTSDPTTTTASTTTTQPTTTTAVSSPAPTQAGEDPPPFTTSSTSPPTTIPLYRDASQPVEARVTDLLGRMSLDEKIGQMTLVEKGSISPNQLVRYHVGAILSGGGGSPAKNTIEGWRDLVDSYMSPALATTLGIPILYGVDAVHGHNNLKDAVIFPHNIGLGAAGDPDLVEAIGRATAVETAATNIRWNFAPVLAVPQDLRWGRTYEAYGEDPTLVTDLSVAFIRGLQGNDLIDPTSVLSTPKHFVADGGTSWDSSTIYRIDQGVAEMDEAELRAIHLSPYPPAFAAGAQTVMASFSSWKNGKVHGDGYLLNDVLREELGFEGLLVSDWGAIDQIYPDDYYRSIVQSINAGVDLNMVPYDFLRFITTLKQAVEAGEVTEERIDQAVTRILAVKFRMGLFETPYTPSELAEQVGSDEHRSLAEAAVRASLVLLEDDGQTLPLDPTSDTPLLVAGDGADDIGIQSGGWTISWQGERGDITAGTTILEALQETMTAPITYSASGDFDTEQVPTEAHGLVVISEDPYAEGVGDSSNLRLSSRQYLMVERMAPLVDKLVVIILSGRPLLWDDALDQAGSVIAAWLPGSEGRGIVQALTGESSFTGTLSFTWPDGLEQLGVSRTDPCLGARYPRGYGLSLGGEPLTDASRCAG